MELRPKKMETRLYVRLTAEEKEQLQLLATTHKSTLSEVTRKAIQKLLKDCAHTAVALVSGLFLMK
jgi:hypothetical protein